MYLNKGLNDECICCGHITSWKKVTSLPKIIFGSNYSIFKCEKCSLAKTLPQPTVNHVDYEINEKYDQVFIDKERLYRQFAKCILKVLETIVAPEQKTLLDVGCGGGFLVEEAQNLGFDACGIEANSKIVAWCRERGVNVKQGDISSIPKSELGNYDVVILSSVIEHLENPFFLVDECRKILNTNGLLVLSQAVYDGLLPKVFPYGWYGWQPQEHYWHFTQDMLLDCFSSKGFDVIASKRTSLHHPVGMFGSVKEFIGRNIAAFIARLGDAFHRGDSCLIVLRKTS